MKGTFAVSYGSDSTDFMSFDVSESAMKTALGSLSSIQSVDVQRSAKTDNGYAWSVTFTSAFGPLVDVLSVNPFGLSATSLQSSAVVTTAGVLPSNYGSLDFTDVSGGAPFTHMLRNLAAGVDYYVQVAGTMPLNPKAVILLVQW